MHFKLTSIDKFAQRAVAHETIGSNRQKFDSTEVIHHLGSHQVDVVVAQIDDFQAIVRSEYAFVPIAVEWKDESVS